MLPAAGLLTLVGVSTAVVLNHGASPAVSQASAGDRGDLITAALQDGQQVSRSAERAPLPNEAAADKMVSGHMYVIETDAVDVYADADDTSPVLAVLAPGEQGRRHRREEAWLDPDHAQGRSPLGQVLRPDQGAGAQHQAVRRRSPTRAGSSPTPCASSAPCAPSSRPSAATAEPAGGGGDHGTGRALDIMVDPATGDQIAAFLQKHRSELGIHYLIWQQRIWRPSTSSSWRGMSDRGSPTANHMDHVHASTYGNSGSA